MIEIIFEDKGETYSCSIGKPFAHYPISAQIYKCVNYVTNKNKVITTTHARGDYYPAKTVGL
jgi:hypothetical protein